jgi:hypothetical protein
MSHVARSILAALLVFATLASALHPDAVFAASPSEMDCCRGAGGAMKDSCPFMHLKGTRHKKLTQSDPMCHAGAAASVHGAAMHGHHAMPGQTPSAASGVNAIGHYPDQDASLQDAKSGAAAAFRAAVSKPCASDCCCQANSLTRTQRTRDAAAISNKLRPRAPTSVVDQRTARPVLSDDSAARRQYPPRAPPISL